MPIPHKIRAKLKEAGFHHVDLGTGSVPVLGFEDGDPQPPYVALCIAEEVGDSDRVSWQADDPYTVFGTRFPLDGSGPIRHVDGIDAAIAAAKEIYKSMMVEFKAKQAEAAPKPQPAAAGPSMGM